MCAFAFEETAPRRFHVHPVGETPWIQVELDAARRVQNIELARSGPDGAEYEVGFVCAEVAGPVAEEGTLALSLETPEEPEEADLLTLPPEARTADGAREAFSAAEDGRLVFEHALWLARSDDAADHAILREALTSREVVELLGNTTLDRGPRLRVEPLGHRWPLAQILFTLRDSEAASAPALLTHLAGDPLWSDETLDTPDAPADWLLLALASVRPPPAEVLRYWRRHARPGGGYANVTVSALVDNGSDEAIALSIRLLRDGRFPHDERAAWLRRDIAAARDRPEVLAVAEKLVASRRLPSRLHRRLIRDLHGDWNDELEPDTRLSCPALDRVSPEAAEILRRIADSALRRGLDASTRAMVEAALPVLDGED